MSHLAANSTVSSDPSHRPNGLEDPAFRAVVEEYAADQSLFFEDYMSAWIKLQENGVAEQLRDEL